MRDVDMNNANMDADIPQRAVSIYGANEGMDDFPVLKAFQQYIDAEQEKARKRILWLGIFFGGVLLVVIAVFMVLLHGINTRNQALSDRLFEYAVQEANRRQVPAQQPSQQSDAAFKAMTDTLLTIQKKMQDDESRNQQPAVNPEYERKMREDSAKIESAKRLLAQEKKRLADEKERLHQIEVEQQRRKLYPELYEDGYQPTVRSNGESPSRKRTHTLTDDDIRDIIREAYPEATKAANEDAVQQRKTDEATTVEEEEEAIEYFNDDDYAIPVDVKGSSKKVKFSLPLK